MKVLINKMMKALQETNQNLFNGKAINRLILL
jgi:hypothetical protein